MAEINYPCDANSYEVIWREKGYRELTRQVFEGKHKVFSPSQKYEYEGDLLREALNHINNLKASPKVEPDSIELYERIRIKL